MLGKSDSDFAMNAPKNISKKLRTNLTETTPCHYCSEPGGAVLHFTNGDRELVCENEVELDSGSPDNTGASLTLVSIPAMGGVEARKYWMDTRLLVKRCVGKLPEESSPEPKKPAVKAIQRGRAPKQRYLEPSRQVGRCYACCQENCRYTKCSCGCHSR